jgi:hypothetical protein
MQSSAASSPMASQSQLDQNAIPHHFLTIPAVLVAMSAPDRRLVGTESFWMDPTPVPGVVHCPDIHYEPSQNQSYRREGPSVGSREFWGCSDPYRY